VNNMPKLSIHDLRDVSETLLLPLYIRAMESQRPDALIKDGQAVTKGVHYHLLACSVLDSAWISVVSAHHPRPFLFLAEGVLMYFEEAQVKLLAKVMGIFHYRLGETAGGGV